MTTTMPSPTKLACTISSTCCRSAKNTASIDQIDTNNEVFVVQEQYPLGMGGNAALMVQVGMGNWASAVQLGAQQMTRSIQLGDDNSSSVNQNGGANRASVVQTGDRNVFTATQG